MNTAIAANVTDVSAIFPTASASKQRRIKMKQRFQENAHKAIVELLIHQFRAVGGQKNITVQKSIMDRIVDLGGEPPFICVAGKKLEAIKDLVRSAITAVRYLDIFNNPPAGISSWHALSVASAISDAFKIASSDRVLGLDLAVLEAAQTDEETMRAQQGMIVSVDQYVALLGSVHKLAFVRNKTCGLWLGDKNKPGSPNPKLLSDLNRIQGLSKHLLGNQRLVFGAAMDEARLAFVVRSEYPLTNVIRPSDYGTAVDLMQKMLEREGKNLLAAEIEMVPPFSEGVTAEETVEDTAALNALATLAVEQQNKEFAAQFRRSADDEAELKVS